MQKSRKAKRRPLNQPVLVTRQSAINPPDSVKATRRFGFFDMLKAFFSRAWAMFLVIGSILGFASALVVFLPSVSVSYGDLSDAKNLLSVPLTVKNDGLLPLRDVGIGMGVCKSSILNNAGGPVELRGDCSETGELKSVLQLDTWQHHKLRGGENFSVSLSDLLRPVMVEKMTYGDISIVVRYIPWYFPFGHLEKQVRLVSYQAGDGRLGWRFKPLD